MSFITHKKIGAQAFSLQLLKNQAEASPSIFFELLWLGQ
ncbi:hypothetical protein BPUTEOMOX_1789 [methanotrophic endosymbiont of Bathymodiolus puteoserpentis (Logatchev)]|nr:hypothetical protein BPUTEOMOX_1789 [methanotrophic endosymbiont of Bathymodiolus puteoserpentis (Logatchev)]